MRSHTTLMYFEGCQTFRQLDDSFPLSIALGSQFLDALDEQCVPIRRSCTLQVLLGFEGCQTFRQLDDRFPLGLALGSQFLDALDEQCDNVPI